ncbi:hypothetical protein LIER_39621 [Lithospermum erythrorhizon]|uniref:DUF4283 domain-containing protein n=1 Tax=Lithospermum erythrorhizon TaxID=34254 RepID=A0AAV3QHN0_LITER
MEGFVKSRWAELGAVDGIRGCGTKGVGKRSLEFLTTSTHSKAMEVGMALEKPYVSSLPIWVQYPHLPIDLWTPEALSRISSQMGKPLFADGNTSEQKRMGYA